jgi:hypothetical protein
MASGDFETFIGVFDPRAVWVGIGDTQPCQGRDEIRTVMEEWMREGNSVEPELVADTGDSLVFAMHPDPPVEGTDLYQVFRIQGDRVVRLEDYPDRRRALEAVRR